MARKKNNNNEIDFINTDEKINKRHNDLMSCIKQKLDKTTLTKNQYEYYKKILNSNITLCSGPSGTAKTFVSCYSSLRLLSEGVVSRIYLTKPIQEAGESLGFLPGGIDEKIDPYFDSYYSTYIKLVGESVFNSLVEGKYIISKPLAYLRGDNLDDSCMMIDELQNANISQIMLWITRMGKNTKAVGFGDISQYDIHSSKIGMSKFIRMVQDIEYVSVHNFTPEDIVRNPILIKIVERYEKLKYGKDKNEDINI